MKAYNKEHYSTNIERLRAKSRAYQADPSRCEKKAEYMKAWRAANPEKIKARARARYTTPEFKRKNVDRQMKLRRERPLCRIQHNIASLIGISFRSSGYAKKSRTHEILGCDYPFFKAYIEARFLPGMSWENRSLWHMDHIVPVSSAKTEKELLKLNHYTNFRPLWAEDNIRKGDKVTTQLTLLAA
jgi:hypothetical protein